MGNLEDISYGSYPMEKVKNQGRDIDVLTINTIRTLCMDAVQKANSGHPGTPMALAPLGYMLWKNALNFDPEDTHWVNRDRFVLSVGHASTLLYSLIFLAGFKDGEKPSLTIEDLKNFRQLGSKTPGHPEYHLTAGVETTTGPLGQGFGNSVGMAIAQKFLAARYNRPSFEVFNYRVYAVGGDGCLMEGVSAEAASLAGYLRLNNLIWFYDNNQITIDGSTKKTFTEDVQKRFESYGWNVLRIKDVNDLKQIEETLRVFKNEKEKPTLVITDTHIGYGSPRQDQAAAHGEPLGEENIKLTKKFLGWPETEKFLVPEGVKEQFSESLGRRGQALHLDWKKNFEKYRGEHKELAQEIEFISEGKLPEDWDKNFKDFIADPKGLASRESSGQVLNWIGQKIPWLLGGSADLAASTKTTLKFEGVEDLNSSHPAGRNINFGIREHAMGAVTNGLALSGLRPYGSTFLVFNDYQKPSVRLAALMGLNNIFIYTHDSIGLGEDGPTHQPIEQLPALRAIPGLVVLRPADANEVVQCWKVIMSLKRKPAALVLSRQALPTLDRKIYAPASGALKGAYILADTAGAKPQVILIATGSEVSLCIRAFEDLTQKGIPARVVSMPSWEIFEEQDENYKERVLPSDVMARVCVEAAAPLGWERYAGPRGKILGMGTFGASAPSKNLYDHFGFDQKSIIKAALEVVG